MKIAFFIVTYKNDDLCERAISSILKCENSSHQIEINVINNYSKGCAFRNKDEYTPVKFLDNSTRSDLSTGHLSRDWNSCLILGFENLSSPKNDIVVTLQNDAVLGPRFLERVEEIHECFDFVAYGKGDEMQSYTPTGVKKIGMWDERFCNIGFQEADYFLRAATVLGSKASINDVMHHRIWNPLTEEILRDSIDTSIPSGFHRGDEITKESAKYHSVSGHFFHKKWIAPMERWTDLSGVVCKLDQDVLYPYFEL